MNKPSADRLDNPYVGPRTFVEAQAHLFFGREREARDLTARIVSERLLLFYAQSGAGKSSLINTRVIPWLRDEEGFQVLPVGRVSGELPAGVETVANIYTFNLMSSLDQAGASAEQVARVSLSDFLARLVRETVVTPDGQHSQRWVYKPDVAINRPDATAQPAAEASSRFVLVIDQFEEIITAHPGRWEERSAFFRQLNQALLDDPTLWVVLTLREDYIASLDPYTPLLFNRLRARFYMERMGVDAALEAIRLPAELGGRPFAEGVAEQLADDLRQVRVAGQEGTIPGQHVEPVQLQVVCYQLWENLGRGTEGIKSTEQLAPSEKSHQVNQSNHHPHPTPQITFTDLAAAGDVNKTLTQFYEETLAAALADPAAAGVSERQLRAWFDQDLITEAGTRGLVHQGESETGGLPNGVVRALGRRFLVRAEAHGGDAWIELVHDRFVEPIRSSNAAWFPAHLSTLQRQAALWDQQRRPAGLLLLGEALTEAEEWAEAHALELALHEREFLTSCRKAQEQVDHEHVLIQELRQAKANAEEATARAERQTRRARAGELVGYALTAVYNKIDASGSLDLILAQAAVEATRKQDQVFTIGAYAALKAAIDSASPYRMTLPRHRHAASVLSAAYSPKGRQIVTTSADQTARIWNVSVDDLLAHAGRLIQRDPPLLTPEERKRYGFE